MNLIVTVLGVAYGYERCDTCKYMAVVRDTQYDAWICFGCARWTPAFKNATPKQRLGLQEAYKEAEIQLGKHGAIPATEDVPLERMIASCDLAWWKELA